MPLSLFHSGQVVLKDLPVNLGPQGEDDPTAVVVTDFAWIMDDSRNILAFAASNNNDLVLVDLDDDDFRMTKLALTAASVEANGGSERQIEWAQDTNYVWVNARDTDELIVVELPTNNIDDARVIKTIPSHDQGDLIFVENFDRKAAVQMMQELTSQALADYQPPADPDDASLGADRLATADDGDDDIEAISVTALALSIIAMLVGAFAVYRANSAIKTAVLTSSTKAAESVSTSENHAGDNVSPGMY